MYILHSFDKGHWRLYREARALHPDLNTVKSMWAVVNLDYCKTNMGRFDGDSILVNGLTYDDSFQNAMYMQVGVPHYLWRYENALCLNDEERKYSFIVLLDENDNMLIGRYGTLQPEYEEDQVYLFNPDKPWLSLAEVSTLDETLGNILTVLFS